MLRLYVHYEGSPEHTHLAKVAQSSDQTVASLKDEFVKAYNARHGTVHPLSASNLELRNEKRRLLENTSSLVKAVRDRADLFIVEREGEKDKGAAPSVSGKNSGEQANKMEAPPPLSAASTGLSSRRDLDAVDCGVIVHGTDDKQGSTGPGGPGRTSLGGSESAKPLSESVGPLTTADKANGGPSVGKAVVSSVEEIRAASERSLSVPLVRALLTKGLEAQDAQNYRQATNFFEDVLQVRLSIYAFHT